jgi:hypothetical protein
VNRDDIMAKIAKNKEDSYVTPSVRVDGNGRMTRVDFIKKAGSEYGVYSESGKLLGKHPSKEEAAKQLAAIEASKARQDDVKKLPATSPLEDEGVHVQSDLG